jgi:hypothetical protein
MTVSTTDQQADGRDETRVERSDRNFVELLQELRVVQTGVQVLFAFLLTVPFAARFDALTGDQRALYFATLLCAGMAIVLLVAPTAWHRALFRRHDKTHLVTVSNRFTIAGLVCVALSTIGVVLLIATLLYPGAVAALATAGIALALLLCWCLLPLRRRRADMARR